MRAIVFIIVFGTIGSTFVLGQGRTVTNTDLEKYKQKRVRAEADLKEYYAKAGLTEEDLLKREVEETKAREALSTRLRAVRLEQERIAEEARTREESARQVNVIVPQPTGYDGAFFLYGDRFYPIRGPRNNRFRRGVTWRATPMGIIYEPGSLPGSIWSPRPATRPSTAWRQPGRRW